MKAKQEWAQLLKTNNIKPTLVQKKRNIFKAVYELCNKSEPIAEEFLGKEIKYSKITGFLAVKGKPVFAYMRRKNKINNKLPSVHFVYCKIIKESQQSKFFCSTEFDTGFLIDVEDDKGNIDSNPKNKELEPCGWCIAKFYNTTSGQEGRQIKAEFSFEDISAESNQLLLEEAWSSRWFKLADLNWEEISYNAREKANWTCDNCNIIVGKGFRRFLDTHHVDHDRNFNHSINLKVLCIKCHDEQEGHNFKSHKRYSDFMKLKNEGKFRHLET